MGGLAIGSMENFPVGAGQVSNGFYGSLLGAKSFRSTIF